MLAIADAFRRRTKWLFAQRLCSYIRLLIRWQTRLHVTSKIVTFNDMSLHYIVENKIYVIEKILQCFLVRATFMKAIFLLFYFYFLNIIF